MALSISEKKSSDGLDEAIMHSAQSARVIVPMLQNLANIKSVVEFGCRAGEWLAVFKNNGVTDILGIDKPRKEHDNLAIQPTELTRHDLAQPFSLDRRFDLAMCFEVAEYLPESYAEQLVDNLTRLSPMVLFAAAIPHQGKARYLNPQWPEYWARIFAARGFRPVDCIREAIWPNEEVSPSFAQNLILYVREDQLRSHPQLQEFAKQTNPAKLTMIHPKNYVKNYYAVTEPKILFVRMIWNAIPLGVRRHLVMPLREFIWKMFA